MGELHVHEYYLAQLSKDAAVNQCNFITMEIVFVAKVTRDGRQVVISYLCQFLLGMSSNTM